MNSSLSQIASLFLVAATLTSQVLAADKILSEETFDTGGAADGSQTPGGYETKESGVTATRAFKEGAGVKGSRAMVLSAGFNWNSPDGLAAVQYQIGRLAGNNSTDCAEYYIEFDAKSSKPGKDVTLVIQGWKGEYFQGDGTGSLTTTLTLPDKENTFQTYRVSLADAALQGKFDPSGKTWQIIFQIMGANWGGGDDSTLVIDNIKVGYFGK